MQDIHIRLARSMRHSIFWHLFRAQFLELAREKPVYAILMHFLYSDFELFELPGELERWSL